MDVGTGLMELWKNALADLTGFVDRAFGEEDDNFPKLLVGSLCDDIRYAKMGAKLTFEFFGLDLETTGADCIVPATEDAEILAVYS